MSKTIIERTRGDASIALHTPSGSKLVHYHTNPSMMMVVVTLQHIVFLLKLVAGLTVFLEHYHRLNEVTNIFNFINLVGRLREDKTLRSTAISHEPFITMEASDYVKSFRNVHESKILFSSDELTSRSQERMDFSGDGG